MRMVHANHHHDIYDYYLHYHYNDRANNNDNGSAYHDGIADHNRGDDNDNNYCRTSDRWWTRVIMPRDNINAHSGTW